MGSDLINHPRVTRLIHVLLLNGVLVLTGMLALSQAQMTLDGSPGLKGPLTGPNYRIGADVAHPAAICFIALANSMCGQGRARPSRVLTRLPISWGG